VQALNGDSSHAVVAQLVEHLHGKEKVCGSIPHNGSRNGLEKFDGSVVERSNTGDCKSPGFMPSQVRILSGPPEKKKNAVRRFFVFKIKKRAPNLTPKLNVLNFTF
jgi:hypothetical protein